MLQISSYWREGDDVTLKIEPDTDIAGTLKAARKANGRQAVQTALSEVLPKRLAQFFVEGKSLPGQMADFSDKAIDALVATIQNWNIRPAGSEGYRTAEVTLGGVATTELDSKTMQAKSVPGLHFIGECVDVTGWLGGYNFQWAWASGHACGDSL